MTDQPTLHRTLATPAWDATSTLQSALAAIATTAAFWWFGGWTGVVVGVSLGVVSFVLPVVFVFALAQVALAVLVPAEPALTTVLLGEVPLFLLLGSPVGRRGTRRRAGVALFLGGIVFGASMLLVAAVRQLWLASGILFGVVALTIYSMHRYTVVAFGGDTDE